jgi:hypothetical protein
MARPATSRVKFNPPLGNLPALQYLLPAQLSIDPAYQRSIEGEGSQRLIRKIAQFWNWDLCQPLVVSRRDDGALYVIDGQHRLEAARLRGDIAQLPAVVVQYAAMADEAASFVHLNEARRPLTKLEVFKAAVASGDTESCAIVAAMEAGGLSLAPHANIISWQPGMVMNIAGLQVAWREHGAAVFTRAARVIATAWPGEALRYAGTVWPGIAALCADEPAASTESLAATVGGKTQAKWNHLHAMERAENPNLRFKAASELMMRRARGTMPTFPGAKSVQASAPAAPRALKFTGDKGWCGQCEAMVTRAEAEGCKSRFCAVQVAW